MNTDLRHTFLSRPRYNRYLTATENDNKRAKLYNLIEWIDPKLIPFFENLDNIQSKVSNIMSLK